MAVTWIRTAAADIVSTELLLRDDRFTEGNPLMKSRAVRIGARAAMAGGMIYLHRHYKRKGEHSKAKTVLIITTAVWAAATMWNVRQMTRDPGQDRALAAYTRPAAQLQVHVSW